MRIILAPDKFKDSCSASDVCAHLTTGLRQVLSDSIPIIPIPLADGGEGTLDALASVAPLELEVVSVLDPLNRPITAQYARMISENTAVIEMAQASGIQKLFPFERSATLTSSIGTGLLIRDAIEKGVSSILLTVGGTATNDGGLGIAHALGVRFYDIEGNELPPIGLSLSKIHAIDSTGICFDPTQIRFEIATDVSNSLLGTNGAAKIYGPQKGASLLEINELELGMGHLCSVLSKHGYTPASDLPGSGAGGGVAATLVPLFHASIISATDWLFKLYNLPKKIRPSDVLITGEGKVDRQTWEGKLIHALTTLAAENEIPIYVICGTLEDLQSIPKNLPIKYLSSILHCPLSFQEALSKTDQLLIDQGIILGHIIKNSAL